MIAEDLASSSAWPKNTLTLRYAVLIELGVPMPPVTLSELKRDMEEKHET